MKDEKKFDQRKADEKKEGYSSVNSDLPKAGFQETKQVLSPDQLGGANSAVTGADGVEKNQPDTIAAKELKSKIKVRPDVSVEQLEGKQVGGVPLAGAQATRSVAGVSSQSPADDYSKTPYSKGDYRPSSRYGKKRSEDLFLLDNQVSEQVVPQVDDSKDLKDAPDSKQGYNGRKQFKQTRSKKNFSYTNGSNHVVQKLPQQLLNDASVDLVHVKKRIYTSGQMITGTNESASDLNIPVGSDYPTVSMNGNSAAPVDIVMHKGNYEPKALNITVTNGKISGVNITEDYYELHTDPISRDQANMNLQVDSNNIVKAVIKMQNELGRETTDKWSPLGYVIHEPYEYNTLYHDIEASLGAIMATAYRSAVSSLAFQRNINGKDGINPQSNAIKMILEGYTGILESNDSDAIKDTSFNHMLWKKSEYAKGSVAALIDMFDTTGKYKTKADILGLQRSLTLHLSQADNNINPLHCKPAFIKALNKAHMFSTMDGQYNPMLPIFSTKSISLVNPLSLNVFLANWKNPAFLTAEEKQDKRRDISTGTYANYVYKYKDIRSEYTTRVQHPLIEGILRWLLNHEGAFVSTYGENASISIPFTFDFENPCMIAFLLCSASQDVAYERNVCFRDIIFAGEQATYVWDDLEGLDKLNPLYSSQMKINGYNESLTLGKLDQDTALRELWSDQMQLTKHSGGKVQYMLPWHFNETAFGNTAGGSYTKREGFFNEESAFNMSIPSIREGVRHEYVDLIKSMEERDIRLALDRKVDIPVFDSSEVITGTIGGTSVTLWTKHTNYNSSETLNAKVKLSTLRYDPNSDGRVIAVYDMKDDSNTDITHHALYLCAKEIGFIDDDYSDYSVITEATATERNDVWTPSITLVPISSDLTDNSGFNTKYYSGCSPMYITSYRVQAESYSDGAIDRSAALTQVFYRFFANVAANVAGVNVKFINKTGIIPCLGYLSGLPADVYGVYNLGSNVESTSALDKQIRTHAHRVWTMLQRFFLPVNRFENVFNTEENVDYDPLEMCFYFGLCGTLASDFTQDVLERLDVYDQLGLDYTEDYFCKDSLIFRLG